MEPVNILKDEDIIIVGRGKPSNGTEKPSNGIKEEEEKLGITG